MRNKYLLGANRDNELVFGEFEITYRNGYAEFTASFNTVRPFNGENFDLEEFSKECNVYYGISSIICQSMTEKERAKALRSCKVLEKY